MNRFEITYYIEEYCASMVIIAYDLKQIADNEIEVDGAIIVIDTSSSISINIL